MTSPRLAIAAALIGLSAPLLAATSATTASAAPAARAKVTVVAPPGVPAAVTLTQGKKKRVVTKRAKGRKKTKVVSMRPGRAKVTAPTVTFRGKTYRASVRPQSVRLVKGKKQSVRVVYRKVKAAQAVTVGRMTASSVKVVWKGRASGERVRVRITNGTKAAANPRSGKAVKVRKKSASATGLRTGKAYTFTVFTMRGRKVLAAQSVTATPFSPKSAKGGFVAPGTTRVYTNPKSAPRAKARGEQALVPVGGATPPVGAGYVLPRSNELPGGYIGVVDSITPDGRHAILRPAALDEVFDALYGSGKLPGKTVQSAMAPSHAADSSWLRTPDAIRPGSASRLAQAHPAAELKKCLGGTLQGETVKLSPRFTPTGTFDHGFSKKKIFGKEIPTGAFVNASFNVNVEAPLTVRASATMRCRVPLAPANVPFQAGPVPMLFQISPVAEVSVTGRVDVEEVGYGGNIGASLGAKFSLPAKGSISGTRTLDAYPLTPKVALKTGNWRVGVAIGGDIIVGPGKSVGKSYGAVAGVEARVRFLDGRLGPKFPVGDSRHLKCYALTGTGYISANLTAKAWFKSWNVRKTLELGRLEQPYGTAHFPNNCEKEQGEPDEEVSDDVLGDDVDKVDDELEGSEDQWGRTDAFTPGTGAWVLSTGLMSHIPGVAGDSASTNLGLAGNDRLSALSGFPTYDAVTYRTTIIPKKPNLHVRYLFASEEYLAYVNSDFNDVMGVFVDGQNCALVAGLPVSVNAINPGLNADKYVDNTGGTTSMNGWTVPLQCDVPVTVGKPVVVEIAVADSSDHILDSAVALLDQGIWAD